MRGGPEVFQNVKFKEGRFQKKNVAGKRGLGMGSTETNLNLNFGGGRGNQKSNVSGGSKRLLLL